MRVGTLKEIWRYPVKSMAGTQMTQAEVGALGIGGDRGWALRDEEAGEIRGAKKLPALLRCAARYVEEPREGRIPPAEITLPDGGRVRSDDPRAAARLSGLLGRRVTLWPRQPADDLTHYRRGKPDDPDFEKELRQIFGRLDDEPLPDLSVFPQELFEYTSPRGTYFDAMPLHLLTTTSLATLSRANPEARFDRRRFRPNFLVETGGEGLVETGWCGQRMRVGSVEIQVEMPTARCSMTVQAQADLPKDPSVLRTIVHDAAQNLGVYARVTRGGTVRIGDAIELL